MNVVSYATLKSNYEFVIFIWIILLQNLKNSAYCYTFNDWYYTFKNNIFN